MRRVRRRTLGMVGTALLALVAMSACGGGESSPTATSQPAPPTATTAPASPAASPRTSTPEPTATPGSPATSPGASAATEPPAPVTPALQLLAEGLTAPVQLVEPPDGTGRLFIVDQAGMIRILMPDGTLLPEPFLDVRDRMVRLNSGYDERGLLGLAFHPSYAENGRFFVYYSAPLASGAPEGFNHTSHISEFHIAPDDPNRADPNSERIVLQVNQPQTNHNGGTLAFGPDDGYLYISLGDGGGGDDVGGGHVEDWYPDNSGGNGQDVEQNLLGSILRIDVDNQADGQPYGIPQDNPFVGRQGLPEIYAYGFRNPYRFSFDMGGDHALISQDAGQELWEEFNVVTAGGNYGWNVKEGTHCFDAENPSQPADSCPDSVGAGHPDEGKPLIDPVIEFGNSKQGQGLGLTGVGGYVYRGAALPQFEGQYIFGAWSTSFSAPAGRIFAAQPQQQGPWPFQEIQLDPPAPAGPQGIGHFVLGFGQDQAGEVYVLTSDTGGPAGNTGRVYKLAPAQEQ